MATLSHIFKGNTRDMQLFAASDITKGNYNERAVKYFQLLGATSKSFNTAYKQVNIGGELPDPVFSPNNLFSNGETGFWYDPSDLSTLFTDIQGTTQVTSDGDPVGLMLDKSGNNLHVGQSVSADRPVYRTDGSTHWLAFDGISSHLYSFYEEDFLSIPAYDQRRVLDIWASSSLTSVIGFEATDSDGGDIFTYGSNSTNDSGYISYKTFFGQPNSLINGGLNRVSAFIGESGLVLNNRSVATLQSDHSIPRHSNKVGSFVTNTDQDWGTQRPLDLPPPDGGRYFALATRTSSSSSSGNVIHAYNLYSIVFRDGILSTTDKDALELYIAEKTGTA